ncbi:hypothetical protein GGER_37490 [Serratia rubidaea]
MMRGRLFWKILLGYWLIFIIMMQVMWVSFAVYGNREPPENALARRLVNMQITSAVSMLQSGGMPALNAMIADWSAEDRRFLRVTPASQPPVEQLSPPVESGRMPKKLWSGCAAPTSRAIC